MIKKLVYLFVLFFLSYNGASSQTLSESVASTIANKMKDSLNLSDKQWDSIYKINLHISDQKNSMRLLYSGTDSLAKKIQRIENKRDSLYRPVFTGEQHLKYKQKKRSLVSSD